MRRSLTLIILSLVLVLSLLPVVALAEDDGLSGEGTEESPYLISTKAELQTFASLVQSGAPYSGAYYRLGADIVLNDEQFSFDPDTGLVKVTDGDNCAWRGTGLCGNTSGDDSFFDTECAVLGGWYVRGPEDGWAEGAYAGELEVWPVLTSFSGTFDGAGHAISGLYYTQDNKSYSRTMGFVEKLENGGVIKDLTIRGSYYFACSGNGSAYMGAVAGVSYGTIERVAVENCVIEGGNAAGSVTGDNKSLINNCFSSSVVIGGANMSIAIAGGISAHNHTGGGVKNSLFAGALLAFGGTDYMYGIASYAGGYNNYALTGDYGTRGGCTLCTPQELADGSIAYKLNGSVQGGDVWRQNVDLSYGTDADPYPLLSTGSGAGHGRVYCSAGVYFNECSHEYGTSSEVTKPIGYVNGYTKFSCSVCGESWYGDRVPGAGEPGILTAEECGELGLSADYTGAYKITTMAELRWFASLVNGQEPACHEDVPLGLSRTADACAVLMDDITDNSGVLNENGTLGNAGTPWEIIGNPQLNAAAVFSGRFNGMGHSISGLYCLLDKCSADGSVKQYAGLFGKTKNAVIENITLRDSYFASQNSGITMSSPAYTKYIGGIAGYAENTVFTNCSNEATVYGTENNRSTLSGFSTCCKVFCGGIAGYATGNSGFSDCLNEGSISACAVSSQIKNDNVSSLTAMAGGIVGYYYPDRAMIIANCYNSGSIYGKVYKSSRWCFVGGIAGQCNASINSCTNMGSVEAYAMTQDETQPNGLLRAGGIAGFMSNMLSNSKALKTDLNITNCFNNGSVRSGRCYAGGMVGYTASTSSNNNDSLHLNLSGCFSEGTVYAEKGYAGGILGRCPETSSDYVTAQDCVNRGTIDSKGPCIGGILGEAPGKNSNSTSSNSGSIVRCVNYGTVGSASTTATYAGGIAGKQYKQPILDCANFGDIYAADYAGGLAGSENEAVYLLRSFSVGHVIKSTAGTAAQTHFGNIKGDYSGDPANTAYYTAYYENAYGGASDGIAKTAEQFAGGEVTYLLNGSSSEGELPWHQNVDNDKVHEAYPVLKPDSGVVYRLGTGNYYSNSSICSHPDTHPVIVDPVCLTEGRTDHVCDICGEVLYSDSPTLPAGHTDENGDGICDREGCSHIMPIAPLTAEACEAAGLSAGCTGYFPLESADDLYWFAGYVNGNSNIINFDRFEKEIYGSGSNPSANAVLVADIIVNDGVVTDGTAASNTSGFRKWTAIGRNAEGYRYSGTIDGNGHSISGLFMNATGENQGFVGYTAGLTVRDLTIKDSYFKFAGNACGAFAGYIAGTSEFTNCSSLGNVLSSTAGYIGGLAGRVVGTDADCSFTACFNTSSVTGKWYVGGLLGDGEYAHACNFTACVNTGALVSTAPNSNDNSCVGGITGSFKGGTILSCWATGSITKNGIKANGLAVCGNSSLGNIRQSVYLNTCVAGGEVSTSYGISGLCPVSADDFSSGAAAFLLNGMESSGETVFWSQNLGEESFTPADPYPVLGLEHGPVFRFGEDINSYVYHNYAACDGHDFDTDGYCTRCKAAQPATKVTDENCAQLGLTADYTGYYAVANKGNLAWADAIVTGEDRYCSAETPQDTAMNIVLLCDIVWNDGLLADNGSKNSGTFTPWVPLGKRSDAPYTGTFDGLGHTVRGLYGEDTSTNSVSGLVGYSDGASVRDLKLEGCYLYGHFVGGIVAYAKNGCTVEACSVTGTLSGSHFLGGICGSASSRITIDSCEADVLVKATMSGGCCGGGIVASVQSGSISNCIGKLRFETSGYSYQNEACFGGIAGICSGTGLTISSSYCIVSCTDSSLQYFGANDKCVGKAAGETKTDCFYLTQTEPAAFLKTFGAMSLAEAATGRLAAELGTGFVQTLGTDALPGIAAFKPEGRPVYTLRITNSGSAGYRVSTWRDDNGESPEVLYLNAGTAVSVTCSRTACFAAFTAAKASDGTEIGCTGTAFTMPEGDVNLAVTVSEPVVELTKTGGKVGYSIGVPAHFGSVKIIIAEYDGGQLVGLAVVDVPDLNGNISGQVMDLDPEHDYALFLLDSADSAPLCGKAE